MKSIKIRSKFYSISDEYLFVSSLLNERKTGLIGRECRFLSGLIASFKSKVSIKKVYRLKKNFFNYFKQYLKDYIFYFMELFTGNLEEYLDKFKLFNEKVVSFYSAQILCGILFLHSKNIIHRY